MLPETEIVTINKVAIDIIDSEPVYFDLETQGLYGTIQIATFYQQKWNKILFVENPDPACLSSLLININHLVGHNIGYDLATIVNQLGNINFTHRLNKISDTFYASRLVYPREKSHSLKNIHAKALGYNAYNKLDVDNKLASKIKDWDLSDEVQKNYCALDVYVLPTLFSEVCQVEEEGSDLNISYKLDIKSMLYGIEIQANGYPIVPGRAEERIKELKKYIEDNDIEGLNVNSYVQVRKYLDLDEDTPTDKNNLAKLIVDVFNDKQKYNANKILDLRAKKKELTFLEKYANYGESIHGEAVLYGHLAPNARSGRFTSSDENLQNIPRKFYSLFGTTNTEHECVITADYSQLELRLFAAIVGDEKMAQTFRNNVDIHTLTTKEMFGVDNPTEEQRFIGKSCNFLLLYGGGSDILLTSILKTGKFSITSEQARDFHHKFLHKAWKKVYEYKKQGFNDLREGRIWKTILGRPYIGQVITDFLNIKIQGSGADVAKLAMHYMYTPEDKNFMEDTYFRMRNFIHDAYVVTCKKSEYKRVAEHVGSCMVRAWETCLLNGIAKIRDVPMPVEVYVSDNVDKHEYGYDHKLIVTNKFNWEK